MRAILAISFILFTTVLCFSQSEEFHLSYPQHQARANAASYNKLMIVDTIFEFTDQFRKYHQIKETKYRNDTVINRGGFEFVFEADTSNFFLEYPNFRKKFFALVPPFIDTVMHPEDNSIIIRLDTTKFIEEDYAHLYELNPTVVFQTIEQIEEIFKKQNIEIEYIHVDSDNPSINDITRLMNIIQFDDCERIQLGFLLSKNDAIPNNV